MSPNDISEAVRHRPFEPFRLLVTGGTHYDIQHPDQCMVLATAVIVGLTRDPDSPYYERSLKIDCRHILKMHELPITPAGNGQSNP